MRTSSFFADFAFNEGEPLARSAIGLLRAANICPKVQFLQADVLNFSVSSGRSDVAQKLATV